jgi:hypothetical protein
MVQTVDKNAGEKNQCYGSGNKRKAKGMISMLKTQEKKHGENIEKIAVSYGATAAEIIIRRQ